MDSHPIPQDVTGFQFRLIGDMTVKQFAYLVSGAILAWVAFSLPISAFIKLPFSLFFGCFGAALAFLPVEGRPLDLMAIYFFKALISPNQFLFIKNGSPIIPVLSQKISHVASAKKQPNTISEESLQTLLASNAPAQKGELDQKELLFLQSVSTIFQGGTQVVQPQQSAEQKNEEKSDEQIEPEAIEEVEQELEEQTQIIKEELEQVKANVQKEEVQGTNNQELQESNLRIAKLEQLLNETLSQKNQLEQQLLALQKQFSTQNQSLAPKMDDQKVQKNTVKTAAQTTNGMEVPNLIAGIIKDPRGNVLPNILVEIRDKDGNPVRAFKTNKLGQFASATPLLNGIYTIVFEDPAGANKFDTLEITAKGEVIQPLEIKSIDAREELRKSLFNN